MCGRFALYSPGSRIRAHFRLDNDFHHGPRYNIAPMTTVLAIFSGADGAPAVGLYRWGLLPGWMKKTTDAKLFNARSETILEKPAFRTAFRRSRCLIPANGFYEWKTVRENGRPVKQPYYIRPEDGEDLFGFAGLAEYWRSPAGEVIHSCCIITTAANAFMQPIHHRMPVILGAGDYGQWLDTSRTGWEALRALLLPKAAGMIAYPVSRAVNSSREDSQALVEPV
ncbi:MAG: Putative SOS response-associated peptidase YedK [Candidatus Kentron sp. G]|nr:MAG: Putative SOS response-associated peptidase YedK [Candidatus Kentron sp. G]